MSISNLEYFVRRVDELAYARLKHEVEAYRSASDEVAAAFLALPAPHNQVARVCEGIESLKAENERLRKLGTEMGKHLPDTDEANRAYIDFEAGGRSS